MRISDWSSDVCSSDLFTLATLDDQQVLLCGDVDILRTEPGHGERDAVIVRAAAFDVERGIIVTAVVARLAFEQVKQTVEADGRSEERRVGKECVSPCRSGWAADH